MRAATQHANYSLTILCITVLATTCASAEEFSWEISGSARKADFSTSADAEGATLTATYHFRPVDDAAGPYELAAFLSRSSRIAASYSEDKTTALVPVATTGPFPTPQPSSVTVVDRAAARSLSGRHVWRSSGWYAGAAFAQSDAADPAPLAMTSFSVIGDDLNNATLHVGKYVARSTAVELSLEKAETEVTLSLPLSCVRLLPCFYGAPTLLTSTIKTDSENITISAQHVGNLGDLKYALFGGVIANETEATREIVETPVAPLPPFTFPGLLVVGVPAGVAPGGVVANAAFSQRDRRESYALAGELFPTAALGIRLGYARWDGDASFGESYDLTTTWFFKRRVGARVVLARAKSALPSELARDIDTVTLQLIGRL